MKRTSKSLKGPADQPRTSDQRQYHIHTQAGDLAALCLIVGAPGRADLIAGKYLTNAKRFANDYRGLVSYTGLYKQTLVSVTTSGMGGPSMGIVLPEAVRSGARIFIRVGSCGSLLPDSKVGDVIVPTAAIRFDGASDTWAPKEYPAAADWRVVSALHRAAAIHAQGRAHFGIECTTADFYTGQGRPGLFADIPEAMLRRHQEVLRLGAACYAMEAASLFVWCLTEGGGLPAGAVNAVFANRFKNEFGVDGEPLAIEVALEALRILSEEEGMAPYLSRARPTYA
jgi:uridine phosphorylase